MLVLNYAYVYASIKYGVMFWENAVNWNHWKGVSDKVLWQCLKIDNRMDNGWILKNSVKKLPEIEFNKKKK